MGVSTETRPWFPFADRADAGLRLARKMVPFRRSPDTLVLALARGGVPVGQAVASALALPWDVMVVRKLGVPGSPETAFGALARYGALTAAIHLPGTMEYLRRNGYAPAELDHVDAVERAELARRQARYVTQPQPAVAGRTILLCDDGAATGATLQAAVGLLRQARAGSVHVCVPAAPARTCSELAALADGMTCLQPWSTMHSVSEAYLRFDQLDDARVEAALSSRTAPET